MAGAGAREGPAATGGVPATASSELRPETALGGRGEGGLRRLRGILVLIIFAALGYALTFLEDIGPALADHEIFRGPAGETVLLWVERPPHWPLGPQVRLIVSSIPVEVDVARWTVALPGAGAKVLPRDWPAVLIGPGGWMRRHELALEAAQGHDVLELGRRVALARAYGEVRRALLALDPRLAAAWPQGAAPPAPPP